METHLIHLALEPARATDSTNEHSKHPDMGEYKTDEKVRLELPYPSKPTANEAQDPFADFDRKGDV